MQKTTKSNSAERKIASAARKITTKIHKIASAARKIAERMRKIASAARKILKIIIKTASVCPTRSVRAPENSYKSGKNGDFWQDYTTKLLSPY
jgi:methyl-accepting chemotaxis protein